MWLGEQINAVGVGNGISLIIFVNIISRGPSASSRGGYHPQLQPGRPRAHRHHHRLRHRGRLHGRCRVCHLGHPGRTPHSRAVCKACGGPQDVWRTEHTHPDEGQRGRCHPDYLRDVHPGLPGHHHQPGRAELHRFLGHAPKLQWRRAVHCFVGPVRGAVHLLLHSVGVQPHRAGNNIRKNGGFIPGIRPGKPTSDYISKVLNRITWFGAIFLALVTVFPSLLQWATGVQGLWFGGTSLLIMVGVALDTMKQIESQLLMRHYKGFLD
jgi:preprotein translocase subunit SecY